MGPAISTNNCVCVASHLGGVLGKRVAGTRAPDHSGDPTGTCAGGLVGDGQTWLRRRLDGFPQSRTCSLAPARGAETSGGGRILRRFIPAWAFKARSWAKIDAAGAEVHEEAEHITCGPILVAHGPISADIDPNSGDLGHVLLVSVDGMSPDSWLSHPGGLAQLLEPMFPRPHRPDRTHKKWVSAPPQLVLDGGVR